MTEPSLPTIKRLYNVSGLSCCFPECRIELIDKTGACVGVVCHIKGKRSGSARYDPSQSEEDRNGFDNLLLLCSNHSKVIDHLPSEALFPVALLSRWKFGRETVVRNLLTADVAFRYAVTASSSDAVAAALLGESTGIAFNYQPNLLATEHARRYAVVLASTGSMSPAQGPLVLRLDETKPKDQLG